MSLKYEIAEHLVHNKFEILTELDGRCIYLDLDYFPDEYEYNLYEQLLKYIMLNFNLSYEEVNDIIDLQFCKELLGKEFFNL